MCSATLRAYFAQLLQRLNLVATGSANRIARMRLMDVPPSVEKNEITDKGSINQRAVLAHRAALVEAMHEQTNGDALLIVAGEQDR